MLTLRTITTYAVMDDFIRITHPSGDISLPFVVSCFSLCSISSCLFHHRAFNRQKENFRAAATYKGQEAEKRVRPAPHQQKPFCYVAVISLLRWVASVHVSGVYFRWFSLTLF